MIQSDHSNRTESPVDGDAAVLCVARGVVHRVRAARAHAERRDEAHLVEVEVAALLVEAQLGADQHAHVVVDEDVGLARHHLHERLVDDVGGSREAGLVPHNRGTCLSWPFALSCIALLGQKRSLSGEYWDLVTAAGATLLG